MRWARGLCESQVEAEPPDGTWARVGEGQAWTKWPWHWPMIGTKAVWQRTCLLDYGFDMNLLLLHKNNQPCLQNLIKSLMLGSHLFLLGIHLSHPNPRQ